MNSAVSTNKWSPQFARIPYNLHNHQLLSPNWNTAQYCLKNRHRVRSAQHYPGAKSNNMRLGLWGLKVRFSGQAEFSTPYIFSRTPRLIFELISIIMHDILFIGIWNRLDLKGQVLCENYHSKTQVGRFSASR